MNYPEKLLRGIPNKNDIDEEGNPSSHLFQFSERCGVPQREDGFREESINWYDNEGALKQLLTQKKDDGSLQFRVGAAVLFRSDIDQIKKFSVVKQRLDYERRVIPENEYHGNLLLKKDTPKSIMKRIAASIALRAKTIVSNSSE